MKTINSSKLSWYVLEPNSSSYFQLLYCADGDGFIELVDFGDHYLLRDQSEIVKVWPKNEFDDDAQQREDLLTYLENAQNYMAATNNDLFQELRIC